jgi:hypothetical protein
VTGEDEGTVALLGERFGVPGAVSFEVGAGGLVRVVVTIPSAVGHVYLHGAHVTHYQSAGAPLLFTSPRSQFVAGRAIRGGVPVIFPWFGPRADAPSAPEHGFARIAEWSVESVTRTDEGSVAVVFGLDATHATRTAWPHAFHLRHRVVFGKHLEMELEVEKRLTLLASGNVGATALPAPPESVDSQMCQRGSERVGTGSYRSRESSGKFRSC